MPNSISVTNLRNSMQQWWKIIDNFSHKENVLFTIFQDEYTESMVAVGKIVCIEAEKCQHNNVSMYCVVTASLRDDCYEAPVLKVVSEDTAKEILQFK